MHVTLPWKRVCLHTLCIWCISVNFESYIQYGKRVCVCVCVYISPPGLLFSALLGQGCGREIINYLAMQQMLLISESYVLLLCSMYLSKKYIYISPCHTSTLDTA